MSEANKAGLWLTLAAMWMLQLPKGDLTEFLTVISSVFLAYGFILLVFGDGNEKS